MKNEATANNTVRFRAIEFRNLSTGDQFKFVEWSEDVYEKVNAREARKIVDMGVPVSGNRPYSLKRSATVMIAYTKAEAL